MSEDQESTGMHMPESKDQRSALEQIRNSEKELFERLASRAPGHQWELQNCMNATEDFLSMTSRDPNYKRYTIDSVGLGKKGESWL